MREREEILICTTSVLKRGGNTSSWNSTSDRAVNVFLCIRALSAFGILCIVSQSSLLRLTSTQSEYIMYCNQILMSILHTHSLSISRLTVTLANAKWIRVLPAYPASDSIDLSERASELHLRVQLFSELKQVLIESEVYLSSKCHSGNVARKGREKISLLTFACFAAILLYSFRVTIAIIKSAKVCLRCVESHR